MTTDWQKEIEEEFGSGVYQTGFSGDMLPSGSFVVDYLTGIGGLPCGCIIEVFGTEGSGKTTLALTALKAAMEIGRPFVYLDYESTVSDGYLEKLGIDIEKFRPYHVLPNSMEDGLMMMLRFCEKYEKGLIVTDSIAAMPPIGDIEKMKEIIGHVRVASQAGVMSQAIRQLCGVIRRSNNCCLFLNQERSNIDVLGRGLGRKTTPGGAAIKFYSTLRIQMEVRPPAIKVKKVSPITGKEQDTIIGLNVDVRVIKNRLAPSFRRASIVLRMDEGIDNLHTALKVAEHMGLIKKKGAYYLIDKEYSGEVLGERKEHGFERVRNYFSTDPGSRYKLLERVNKYLLDQIQPKESVNDRSK